MNVPDYEDEPQETIPPPLPPPGKRPRKGGASDSPLKGWHKAVLVLVLILILITSVPLYIRPFIAGSLEGSALGRNIANTFICKQKLKSLGKDLTAYAKNNGGAFPLLDDRFSFLPSRDFFIQGGGSIRDFECEGDEEFDAEGEGRSYTLSYIYLGHVARTLEEGIEIRDQFLRADEMEMAPEEGMTQQEAGRKFTRLTLALRDDPDAAAQIPLLIEHSGNHDNGIHVLYMDGSVRLLEMETEFPALEEFLADIPDQGINVVRKDSASEE